MDPIVLDTDVLSRLHRSDLDPDFFERLRGHPLMLTFVTLGEMLRGAVKANWGEHRRNDLDRWLSAWDVIHSDDDISRAWASLVGGKERAGRTMEYNDAWIAACCIASDVALATLNRRHFEGIEGLELV